MKLATFRFLAFVPPDSVFPSEEREESSDSLPDAAIGGVDSLLPLGGMAPPNKRL